MEKERILRLNGIIDQVVNLDTEGRLTALTLLYNLRTAAVEDLSALGSSETQQRWDDVLESRDTPDDVMTLVRDLIQLADDELTMVVTYINEDTASGKHLATNNTDDGTKTAQLRSTAPASTSSELDSYVEVTRSLASNHRQKVSECLKTVRDAIEQGIKDGQDVMQLEEIFHRLEREFWEQCPSPPAGTTMKTERE
jgi:hypothetical protein